MVGRINDAFSNGFIWHSFDQKYDIDGDKCLT